MYFVRISSKLLRRKLSCEFKLVKAPYLGSVPETNPAMKNEDWGDTLSLKYRELPFFGVFLLNVLQFFMREVQEKPKNSINLVKGTEIKPFIYPTYLMNDMLRNNA